MSVTGYADSFGRTVSSSFGTATSGQAYTLSGTASQFSVAPNTGSIAIAVAGTQVAWVDRQTSDINITGQVALSAIPASNLATVGFAAKLATTSNYYVGSMMVATGGAISLRFSKIIAGGLTTIATIATGLTYVANTVYNLRFQAIWADKVNTNVLSLKLWAANAAEPGGWGAVTTDAAITQFTQGTGAGVAARDESTALGTITAKIQNVVTTTYGLPVPAATDPMCADPGVAYPKQPTLESLAQATDTVLQTFDPLVSLAAVFPRVRVSGSNVLISSLGIVFSSTEFNIGTPTDLGFDTESIYLNVGIWLVTFEIQLGVGTVADLYLSLGDNTGNPPGSNVHGTVHAYATQLNDQGSGGSGHFSCLVYSTDPLTPQKMGVDYSSSTGAAFTATYMALSAIKISDYFA